MLDTIDPAAGLVIVVDVDALKANELMAGLGDDLAKAFPDATSPCTTNAAPGTIVATVALRPAFEFVIWGVGTSTQQWLDCLRATAESKGERVTVDGDYLTTDIGGKLGMSYLVLGPDSLVIVGAPHIVSRADLVARTKPREAKSATDVAVLPAGVAIAATAHGSDAMFASLPIKFRTATLAIDVSDHVDIVGRMLFTASEAATTLAAKIQQQGQTLVQMGFLSEIHASSDGDELGVHAELTRASIDKMIALVLARTGGGTTSGSAPTP